MAGIIIALITAFAASLVLTPLAGLLFAPLALYIHEFFRLGQDGAKAWLVTRGLMLGCGWAFVTRFFIGVLQVGLYAWWAFGDKEDKSSFFAGGRTIIISDKGLKPLVCLKERS